MKFAIAVGDIGQDEKVKDLAHSEGADYDGELHREADTAIWGSAACFGDEAGGFGNSRA